MIRQKQSKNLQKHLNFTPNLSQNFKIPLKNHKFRLALGAAVEAFELFFVVGKLLAHKACHALDRLFRGEFLAALGAFEKLIACKRAKGEIVGFKLYAAAL